MNKKKKNDILYKHILDYRTTSVIENWFQQFALDVFDMVTGHNEQSI